ncbi:MAG: hypothetical protein H6Q60_579 [Oscillospiraceae bacterium]|nr:hypothetical protein [Oscillospiraceae bacterium]
MFIITARIQKSRLIAVTAAVVLCGAALIAGSLLLGGDVSASAADGKDVKTNDDRIAYLQSYGWTVNEQPLASEELLIPEQFDDSYTTYLKLQSDQGFDLSQYCGKKVMRYTYEITNYPTGETGVQISLLIYKNNVIGGEVLSATQNGFVHGLAMPS